MANLKGLFLSLIFLAVTGIFATDWSADKSPPGNEIESTILAEADFTFLMIQETPGESFTISDAYLHPSSDRIAENALKFDRHSIKSDSKLNQTPVKSPFKRPRDGLRRG